MATDPAEPRITRHPHDRRVPVKSGDTLLADTVRAIELRERDYPPRQYRPRSETPTRSPFEGDASCFSFGDLADVGWRHARPLAGRKLLADGLALDGGKVDESEE